MKLLARVAGTLAAIADHAVGWLLLATIVVNVAQVFTRYVLNDPLFWTEEVIRYLTVWFTFLGAAACSYADEHMDMNLFSDWGGPRFQAAHRLLIQLLVLAFAGIVVWQGARYTWLNGMQTAPTTGVLMLYIYSATAVGGALIAIVALHKIALAAAGLRARSVAP